MNFYKRSSVGRYSQEEQMMLQAIERLINEKNVPLSKIPECNSLDDLIQVKLLLENHSETLTESPMQELVEMDSPEDENLLDIVEEDFEQSHSEQEQDSEQGEMLNDESAIESATESVVELNVDSDDFISDNYNPFADPIIERSYTQSQGNIEQENLEEDPLELEDSKETPLSDLPPHTKRRAAEQTADTLLKGYAQFAPIPFKWMAKLPESKIEKMAFDGEIDLSIEVSEGLTFDDYMKQTNDQVDEIFKVDKDTLSDIREPLIEVLMEQNMELTPTQRLIAAVLSHLVQMFTIAFNLRQQNNRILSYQKQMTFLMQGSKLAA